MFKATAMPEQQLAKKTDFFQPLYQMVSHKKPMHIPAYSTLTLPAFPLLFLTWDLCGVTCSRFLGNL